jgi:hypothetical protein
MGLNELDMSTSTIPKFINKKTIKKVIVPAVVKTSTTKQINHKDIIYEGNKYTICYTQKNEEPILFVIDSDDKDKVISYSWHLTANNYISRTDYSDEIKKELYLHNAIMDKYQFNGKGQTETVDHLNRIGRDNRKENLKIKSQTEQNFNQSKRERDIILPKDCGIDANSIPKNVYYVGANGNHGECFEINIAGFPQIIPEGKKKYYWRGSRSKGIDLKTKLTQAILHLKELRDKYPELKQSIKLSEDDDKERIEKAKEFNNIIKYSGYPENIIAKNIIEIKDEFTKIDIDENNELAKYKNEIKNMGVNRKAVNKKLPDNCGISIEMLPMYTGYYYAIEGNENSIYFTIDRHPKLIEKDGKRSWSTTRSIQVSITDKYNALMKKLAELQKDDTKTISKETKEEPKIDTIDIPIKKEEVIKGGNKPNITEETKQKLSEAKKGDKNPNKKGITEDHKNNIKRATLGSHGIFKNHGHLIDIIKNDLENDYPTKTLTELATVYTDKYLKSFTDYKLTKDILSKIYDGLLIDWSKANDDDYLRVEQIQKDMEDEKAKGKNTILTDRQILILKYINSKNTTSGMSKTYSPKVLLEFANTEWKDSIEKRIRLLKREALNISVINKISQDKIPLTDQEIESIKDEADNLIKIIDAKYVALIKNKMHDKMSNSAKSRGDNFNKTN